MEKMNILIYCGANSCRSQMAEGYFKFFANRKVNIYSAGTEAKGINPKAVETMAEVGIDLRGHTSNALSEYKHIRFDYVISVCDYNKSYTSFPDDVKQFHYDFPDPDINGTEQEVAAAFRNVREDMKVFARKFVETYLP